MCNYQLEELTEGVGNKVREIRVEIQILVDELGILGAEAVGERFGVDYVQQLVVVVTEFLSHQFIHFGRHVAAYIIGNEALPQIASGALVAQDETAAVDVQPLVAAVVQAAVGPGAEYGGEARLVLQQGPARCKSVHGYEHLAGLGKHLAQGLFHERVLQGRHACAVEIYLTDQVGIQFGGKVLAYVGNYLGARDVVGVVALAHEAYAGLAVPGDAAPFGLGGPAVCYKYHL